MQYGPCENILSNVYSSRQYFFFKWLNLTCQFESFIPDCFTDFVNVAISGTKYFHKVVWDDGIFSNHFIVNFLGNVPVKNSKNRLSFDRVTAVSLVSPFFIGTRCT